MVRRPRRGILCCLICGFVRSRVGLCSLVSLRGLCRVDIVVSGNQAQDSKSPPATLSGSRFGRNGLNRHWNVPILARTDADGYESPARTESGGQSPEINRTDPDAMGVCGEIRFAGSRCGVASRHHIIFNFECRTSFNHHKVTMPSISAQPNGVPQAKQFQEVIDNVDASRIDGRARQVLYRQKQLRALHNYLVKNKTAVVRALQDGMYPMEPFTNGRYKENPSRMRI